MKITRRSLDRLRLRLFICCVTAHIRPVKKAASSAKVLPALMIWNRSPEAKAAFIGSYAAMKLKDICSNQI